jgi:hypothetical protein
MLFMLVGPGFCAIIPPVLLLPIEDCAPQFTCGFCCCCCWPNAGGGAMLNPELVLPGGGGREKEEPALVKAGREDWAAVDEVIPPKAELVVWEKEELLEV